MKPIARPFLSATAAFAAGTDTPRAFLDRCLADIASTEPQVKAFVTLSLDAARQAADRSTVRWRDGKPLSPIDGMPVGIKDVIETIDMPTEMGSPLFTGWRTGRDAAAVAALREAGAVVVGKTVTTEFAATEPGPTHNPWDLDRTPGGSSSGSAAAVASGMVAAALGTQVIGSIVRPASYCGCYGYKPTFGAINRGGSHDYMSQSSMGTLGSTLEDTWQVAREVSSRTGGDPGSVGLLGPMSLPTPKKPRRLALLETAGWKVVEPAARAALEQAVARLKEAGIAIETRHSNPRVAAIETAIEDSGPLSLRLNSWESRWPLNTYAEKNFAGLSRNMQERLAAALKLTQEDYSTDLAERTRRRQLYAQLADTFDGCVTLSAADPAPLGLKFTGNPVFAIPATMLGVPALSLPLLEADGLPLGLQIIGFADHDAEAIAVAGAVRDLLN